MDKTVAIKRKAQQLVQKGDVSGAIAEFEKLFSGGDKDPYDFILVADLLAKRGSMREAVRRYRQAVDEYAKAELYKNAIAVCKKILRISKEDLAIHRTLGDLYTKEGLYGDAQIHHLEFAEGSIRRQEYDAALDVIDDVLKLSPDNVELSEKYVEIALRADLPERGGRELLRRAERVRILGRTDEAEAIRERVSTLAPGLVEPGGPVPAAPSSPAEPLSPAPSGAAGSAAESAVPLTLDPQFTHPGMVAGAGMESALPALASLQTSAEPAASGPPSGPDETPRSPEEYWKAGEVAFVRGDLPRALELLRALLAIAPSHEAALRRLVEIALQVEDRHAEATARFDLGEVYLAREEWDLSRAEYLRSLELDPSNERTRRRIRRLDAVMGAGARGSVDLDSLPANPPAASVRVRDDEQPSGDALIDLEEIIDEFKAGVSERISGEDHESHYDLGMAYMEMGLHEEAIGEFQVASKGSPMELKCLEMIALCFLEKNEPSAAAKELNRALELPGYGPDETISIRYNLGVANERLGNWDRALQHYEEVYLLNVDFLKVASKVKELKQRLARAQEQG